MQICNAGEHRPTSRSPLQCLETRPSCHTHRFPPTNDIQICNAGERRSADASAEGVQRDLLPMIEGSSVSTRHGNIDTSFILFIASGAFHSCKPSDMLAELQVHVYGRHNSYASF